MCHVWVEDARAAMHWVWWWYDGSMDAIVLPPPVKTPFGDVKEVTDVFRSITMRY